MYHRSCDCPKGHRNYPGADPACCALGTAADGMGAFSPAKNPGAYFQRTRTPVAGFGRIEASTIGPVITRREMRGRPMRRAMWTNNPEGYGAPVEQLGAVPNTSTSCPAGSEIDFITRGCLPTMMPGPAPSGFPSGVSEQHLPVGGKGGSCACRCNVVWTGNEAIDQSLAAKLAECIKKNDTDGSWVIPTVLADFRGKNAGWLDTSSSQEPCPTKNVQATPRCPTGYTYNSSTSKCDAPVLLVDGNSNACAPGYMELPAIFQVGEYGTGCWPKLLVAGVAIGGTLILALGGWGIYALMRK